MNPLSPVYTEKAECQDCYKCVRECIQKAIKVSEGHAQVLPERCVLCGHCVSVCPVGAKRVRSDNIRAESLILRKEKVYASLAPSFVGAFPDISPFAVAAAIERLGFAGVSETALGAQVVSRQVASDLNEEPDSLVISSACPTTVDLIEKYYPELCSSISDTLSPLQAHAQMLRHLYGDDIGVVFIGPCIAKKKEADDRPDLVDAALTFEELTEWFDRAGIDPSIIDDEGAAFVPYRAAEGAVYPIEGGMIATLKDGAGVRDRNLLSVSGLSDVVDVLAELSLETPPGGLFLELLACRGGCINGPKCSGAQRNVRKRRRVLEWLPEGQSLERDAPRWTSIRRMPAAASGLGLGSGVAVESTAHSAAEISTALRSVGKHDRSDELNCGSCGYETCRDFAVALIENRAEQTMCAGYMRKLAQKKTDALLRAMPSGVVMVSKELRVLECNRKFVQLLGEEAELLYDAAPGLDGVELKRIVPFWRLFDEALNKDADFVGEDISYGGRVLNGSVFVVQPGELVGGVFQDVTAPAVQRDRIIAQAQEVITRNLSTVQQIASLMGENAAETEAMLTSIIDAFGRPE
ncbi:MAG: [Fe-Fe] hydrogenase large subunit C-terminal domain-containing protein [Spirochaetaceae bacterium]